LIATTVNFDETFAFQDAFCPLSSSLFEPDQIVEMFGCPGSGKTQFSLFLSVKSIMSGKNVIYIDTRNDFSVKRFLEMAIETLVSSQWPYLKPTSN
jgi:RecA/RadA recombinase